MKKQIGILLVLIVTASGCYYDKYDKLYPPDANATCDSTNVTYSVTVRAILDGNCMSCHDSTIAFGGVVLATYDEVSNFASSNLLIGNVKQLSGFLAMPPGAKLSDCDIAKLQKWLNDGLPNN